MIEIPNLEFHAAHACNLYCAECSHYSNFHAGGIVSVEDTKENFDAWRGRLAPRQIAILLDNGFRMDVSQHGNSPAYRKQFTKVLQRLEEWRAAYPALKITVRESHKGWRQQYRMIDGKPMPFQSRSRSAWKICLQRSCTQLFKGHLWKCPALAYFATMERKLRLEAIPAWQLFRDYKACPPTASDNEVREFFATLDIPQCGLCPARKIPFHHQDPTNKEH